MDDVAQGTVSRAERGQLEGVSIPALRRHAKALGAELRISLWFRGAELDRLKIRAWLREPSGAMGGLLFAPYSRAARTRRPASARKRVRRRAGA